jgi:hypothetical protein
VKEHLKQAAFVLAVYAITKMINQKVNIPVIGMYLPGR